MCLARAVASLQLNISLPPTPTLAHQHYGIVSCQPGPKLTGASMLLVPGGDVSWGGVQEGARASSRHTVWVPYSASRFAAKARVRPGGDPELCSDTAALGVPLPHIHPRASSPEEQRLFGPTVSRAPHPCCTDTGATQRACVMSSGPGGVWVVSAESLLQDPVWGSCSPPVSHRLRWSRPPPGSV